MLQTTAAVARGMPDAAPRVALRLIGRFELRTDGRRTDPRATKDRALLAYLACHLGERQPRAALAGLLWGENGDRRARDSLKQAVLRLRRVSGLAAALQSDRQSVTLLADAVESDLGEFERQLDSDQPQHLIAALSLRRGPLLDGLEVSSAEFQHWLTVEREAFDRRHREAALAALRASAGGRVGLDRIEAFARAVLSTDPMHEEAGRELMRLHARRGERVEALRLYSSLRDSLDVELGIVPEPATQAAAESLRGAGQGAAPGGERREPPAPQLAVLPFCNLGDDRGHDVFADGLSEDIITDLAHAGRVRVAPRGASFAMRGLDAGAVADALGVAHVLEGSVRRRAGRVRVTARLIAAESGHQLWARRYDRELDDVFELQDQLAREVASVVEKQLSDEPASEAAVAACQGLRAQPRGTDSVPAYDLFLKGRAFYLRGLAAQNLRIAVVFLQRAVDIDPHFARAYAQLAICESHRSMVRNNQLDDVEFDACRQYSARALELDPALAEAHVGMGLAYYGVGEFDTAGEYFNCAMALDAESFEAHFFQARNLRLRGERAAAAALFERASMLRPSDFRAPGLLGEELQALGHEVPARAQFVECLRRVEAEVADHPDNAGALAFGAAVLADLGRPEQAREWADWATLIAPDDCLVHYNVARTRLMLGEREAAIDALRVAFRTATGSRCRLAMWMRFDQDLAPLAGHPAYERMRAFADAPAGEPRARMLIQ